MKTFRININSVFKKSNLNIAIGNFDGVHIGHQKIIKKLVNDSKKKKLNSAVLSFNPHPRQYFSNDYDDFNIINEEKKIQLFNKLNVDFYIILKFNKKLASLSADEFIKKILFEKLKIKNITVGYDFKFGKDRKGNIDILKNLSEKYNYKISIINQLKNKITSEVYSSSLIRKNIKDGNFINVSSILGRNWEIKGRVIKGKKRASKINFPTANISPKKIIKPKKGVYAIKSKISDKFYDGIANFGVRPTVNGNKLLLEAHLFDFNQNIYGKELTVEFLTFIRDEKKFNDFHSLTQQIKKDILVAKKYHKRK